MSSEDDQNPGASPPSIRRLTYDTYVENGTQQRELPFTIGILANFLGHKRAESGPRFVTVDRENFDGVLGALSPVLQLKVRNTLTQDESLLSCSLEFHSLVDFSPEAIAQQIPPLRSLLELRARLAGLRAQLSSNEKLDELLSNLVSDKAMLLRAKGEEGL